MDTKIVEARKNVTIFQRVTAPASSFTFNINTVPFLPDEVIVKCILYNAPLATEDYISVLYCDFLSDFIGCINDNQMTGTQLHFTINRPVNQTWKFTIFDAAGAQVITRTGDVQISLEFVKYRHVKEGKVY